MLSTNLTLTHWDSVLGCSCREQMLWHLHVMPDWSPELTCPVVPCCCPSRQDRNVTQKRNQRYSQRAWTSFLAHATSKSSFRNPIIPKIRWSIILQLSPPKWTLLMSPLQWSSGHTQETEVIAGRSVLLVGASLPSFGILALILNSHPPSTLPESPSSGEPTTGCH